MKKGILLLAGLIISLNLNTCCRAELVQSRDCMELMYKAALSGDMNAGYAAEELQNSQAAARIDFDELMLLSRFLQLQTGKRQLSDEFLLSSGEVVLNRVASPEFPDTLEEVLAQYPCADSQCFKGGLLPSSRCVRAAMRLLSGERRLKSSVVYQTEEKPENIYSACCDRVLGFTYFCESEHPELYPDYEYSIESDSRLSTESAVCVSLSSEAVTALKDSNIIVYP